MNCASWRLTGFMRLGDCVAMTNHLFVVLFSLLGFTGMRASCRVGCADEGIVCRILRASFRAGAVDEGVHCHSSPRREMRVICIIDSVASRCVFPKSACMADPLEVKTWAWSFGDVHSGTLAASLCTSLVLELEPGDFRCEFEKCAHNCYVGLMFYLSLLNLCA